MVSPDFAPVIQLRLKPLSTTFFLYSSLSLNFNSYLWTQTTRFKETVMNIRTLLVLVLLSWGINANAQENSTNDDIIIQTFPDYSRKSNTTARSAEEQKVMELVEQYISNTLHEYKTKPMYYLKIKKSECHIIVRINDIPVYEDFSDYDCNYDDYDGTLYPVNSCLPRSGKQTFSVEIYPTGQQDHISDDSSVSLKIYHCPDIDKPEAETNLIEELKLPDNIGTQKLKYYTASATFEASLPFDYSDKLTKARDLTQIPDLEEKVLKQYNKIRQYLVDCNELAYQTQYLSHIIPYMDMRYNSRQEIIDKFCYTEMFDKTSVNRKVAPITDFEMVICGNGKLVMLRNKSEKNSVLQIKSDIINEDGWSIPNNIIIPIILYIPENSDKLEIYM
jgi:tRNA(Ile)-lysidine synthase TilS/MesJ